MYEHYSQGTLAAGFEPCGKLRKYLPVQSNWLLRISSRRPGRSAIEAARLRKLCQSASNIGSALDSSFLTSKLLPRSLRPTSPSTTRPLARPSKLDTRSQPLRVGDGQLLSRLALTVFGDLLPHEGIDLPPQFRAKDDLRDYLQGPAAAPGRAVASPLPEADAVVSGLSTDARLGVTSPPRWGG